VAVEETFSGELSGLWGGGLAPMRGMVPVQSPATFDCTFALMLRLAPVLQRPFGRSVAQRTSWLTVRAALRAVKFLELSFRELAFHGTGS
jgi:hypothetical protein